MTLYLVVTMLSGWQENTIFPLVARRCLFLSVLSQYLCNSGLSMCADLKCMQGCMCCCSHVNTVAYHIICPSSMPACDCIVSMPRCAWQLTYLDLLGSIYTIYKPSSLIAFTQRSFSATTKHLTNNFTIDLKCPVAWIFKEIKLHVPKSFCHLFAASCSSAGLWDWYMVSGAITTFNVAVFCAHVCWKLVVCGSMGMSMQNHDGLE